MGKFKLKKKILLIVSILAIPLFLTMAISLIILSTKLFDSMNDSARLFRDSTINAFTSYQKQTYIYTDMIAANQNVKRGAAFNNTGMILQYTEPLINKTELNTITVHNKKGIIIAQAHAPLEFNIAQASNTFVIDALRGQSGYIIEEYRGKPLLLSAMPIIHETEKWITGAVTAGYFIDDRFAQKLKKQSGVDNIIIWNGTLAATSLGKLGFKERSLKLTPNQKFLKFAQTTYDIHFIRLSGTEHPNDGIYLVINNSHIKRTLYSIIIAIFFVFLAVTSIAIFVVMSLSRDILKASNLIIASTDKITMHSYDINIQVDTQDEFKQIADRFNVMASEIKDYTDNLEHKVAKRTDQLHQAYEVIKKKNELFSKELEVARRVQENILPKAEDLPDVKELRFGTHYTALENIGGDLYDIIELEKDVYGILILDVSGHGVPAALVATMAKVTFYAHARQNASETCAAVNKDMFEFIGDLDHFLTAFYGVLDVRKKTFEYTNCGHHPPIKFNPKDQQAVQLVGADTFMIGITEDMPFPSQMTKLEPGDKLLFFTDGLVEARNLEKKQFSYERLYEFIKRNSSQAPQDFISSLSLEVNDFCKNSKLDDDLTMFLVEFLPDK